MEANRNQTGCLKTTLILVGVSLAFIVAIVLVGDFKCAYDVEDWWMPLYPNGETIHIEYDFLRARAWGTTTWSMTTADDIETVKQFYRDTRLFTLKNKTRGLAWGESRVTTLEDAIAMLQTGYETIPSARESEKAEALERINILERALERGQRSLVDLFSVCGI